jgi:glycine/D-amino acid oxidase-like deaminating enzyme
LRRRGERAQRRLPAEAPAAIGAFCAEHGIDAHYRGDGWLWTATSPVQVGAWGELMAELERYQVYPFTALTPEEAAARSGTRASLAGVFESTAATVQPALLARGLRRVALAQGIRVYERSPMRALERSSPPKVRTPKGSLRAGRVVLALNAWAARFRELRRKMVVLGSEMVVTEPMAARLADIGLDHGAAISDSRNLVHYYRTTLDGRIAFGKGGGPFAFANRVGTKYARPSAFADEVERNLRQLYPMLSGVPVSQRWSGPIDRTVKGLPIFGRLGGRQDIVYGTGFSGNGVGPTHLAGRILASLALGRDDEWSGCGLVDAEVARFPPEPMRYFGARLVRAAIGRKERAEDQGRVAGALTERLAALAPAGLVPVPEKGAAKETKGETTT